MQIVVNRWTALLLLIVLLPFIIPIKLYQWLTGTGKKPTYFNTLEGDPRAYAGDRPVVIALWAMGLTVWEVATEQIVQQLQNEFDGKCEFVYVEAVTFAVEEDYKVDNIPAVLVLHHGQEVGRFLNLMEPNELRQCIAKCTTNS
jgi:hypothetical protein